MEEFEQERDDAREMGVFNWLKTKKEEAKAVRNYAANKLAEEIAEAM
jgi:hypothetical protein